MNLTGVQVVRLNDTITSRAAKTSIDHRRWSVTSENAVSPPNAECFRSQSSRRKSMLRTISLGTSLFLFLFWLARSGHDTALIAGVGAIVTIAYFVLTKRMSANDRDGHSVHFLPRSFRATPWLCRDILMSVWNVTVKIINPRLPTSQMMTDVPASLPQAVTRPVRSPTLRDRILAGHAIGSLAILLLIVVGFLDNRPEWINIGLTYALLIPTSTLAIHNCLRDVAIAHDPDEDDNTRWIRRSKPDCRCPV